MSSRTTTRLRRSLPLLIATLLVVPAGVGPATAAPGGTNAAPTTAADEDVRFARTIEEMKGHFAVSLDYARENRSETAAEHAHHPTKEGWEIVGPDVRSANASLAADVEAALEAAPDHARNDSAEAYADYLHGTVFPLLDRATAAVVAVDPSSATFRARVSSALLDRASEEYGEGVADNGTLVDREEYDDARGFSARADALYRSDVRPSLDDAAATDLDSSFEDLDAAITDRSSPGALERVVDSIHEDFVANTGMTASAEGSAATVDRIRDDLHEAVEQYERGDTARAKATVRDTYLSNFEGIEGTLIETDPQLVGDLEAAFNEELPGLMDENASVARVREKLKSMEVKLSKAETILQAQGTTTIQLGTNTTAGGTAASDTTTAAPTTAARTPGFTVLAGMLALLAAGLLARRD